MTTTLPTRAYSAFLFDMDGTLLTSIKAAERVWGAWAASHGLDVASFLPTIHGKRTIETVSNAGLSGIDPEVEAARITAAEIMDVEGVEAIAGAAELLAALPAARWAIVTSAPRALALARIAAAGLPLPAVLVAAEDVAHGKPAPDPFLLGAERLGMPAADCLVFEDTHAGLRSAQAAGMDSVLITVTHTHALASDVAPVASVVDYAGLTLQQTPLGLLRLTPRA